MTFDMVKLTAELGRDEGRRANPYKDSVGVETVGIGHNLVAHPLPGQHYPMTNAQIDGLFAKDVASVVAGLDHLLPWWRNLDDVRQRVLINMAFNLGASGLAGFKQFLHFVQDDDFRAAAVDMLGTLWAKQVGARATRLAAMMRDG